MSQNIKLKALGFLIFALVKFNFCLASGASEWGAWMMFFNQSKINSKLSLHTEIQFRNFSVQPNTEQLLIRLGINYHLGPSKIVTAGYGRITNYFDDGEVFKNYYSRENRAWQQFILRKNAGKLVLENRFRLEQRWISEKSNLNYKNRFRYLFRASFPINRKSIEKGCLFASAYDELFLNFHKNYFDRNRFYFALGYQIQPAVSVQFGCMKQRVGKASKNYLQLGINWNILKH
jgi:hypothetical protein